MLDDFYNNEVAMLDHMVYIFCYFLTRESRMFPSFRFERGLGPPSMEIILTDTDNIF